MRTGLTDTDAAAERYQIYLLQQATTAQRLQLSRALSRTVLRLARRAIRRAHPGVTARELDVLFVANHYGPELGDQVRQYLQRKSG